MIAINDIFKTQPFFKQSLSGFIPGFGPSGPYFSTFYRWKYRHDSR
jgi:hypothetical protein